MNEEVRWRLAFARELVGALPPQPGLRATVVAGSVARGYSDPYSDIELICFWDAAPDSAIRQAIRDRWRATFRLPPADVGHDSALFVRGVPVDLWHRTVADEGLILDRVLREHSRDLGANAELDTILTALPLRGADLIGPWQARAAAYPEPLALGFLREQLPNFHARQLGLAAARENPTAFYHTLTDIHCTLFLALLALNRAYFPTFKWLYRRLDELPIAPPATAARLRRQFADPPPVAAADLGALLLETIDLVAAHSPHLDPAIIAWARHGASQGAATPVARP